MEVREINLNGKLLKLMRIRNPWGDHREWKGPFSDENEEWD
jgi:hypothetical protein